MYERTENNVMCKCTENSERKAIPVFLLLLLFVPPTLLFLIWLFIMLFISLAGLLLIELSINRCVVLK